MGELPNGQDLAVIRKTALFADLGDDSLAVLLRDSKCQKLARGEVLFIQGDPATSFYVVLEGWLKIFRITPSGEEAVIGVFTAGESFAEAAAFAGRAFPASCEAVTDARVQRVASDHIKEKIRNAPDLALSMLASTSKHMRRLIQEIEQLKAHTGAQRVAEFLVSLCPVENGPCTIGLPYDKALIAGRLGMKPESLSRAFARLRSVGVRIDHNTAAINDIARLRGYADEERKSGAAAGPR